jgi:hypothetical protein
MPSSQNRVGSNPKTNQKVISVAMNAKLFVCGLMIGFQVLGSIFGLGSINLGKIFSINTAHAATGINQAINYQGKLMDSAGNFVADGDYNIIFSIYDAATAGTRLWTANGTTGTPTAVSVSVQSGLFSVLLGDVAAGMNAFSDGLFNNDTLYLGVTIGADAEMTPRKRLAAVPYAFNSQTLQGQYASNTVSNTGGDLFALRQGSADSAASTRTALYIETKGTSNLNDFLIRASDSISDVFTVSRQGNVTTTGNLTVDGGTMLNNTLNVSATSTLADLALTGRVNSNLLPYITDTYNLGNSTYRWLGVTAQNINAVNVSSTNIDALGYVSTTNLYSNTALLGNVTTTNLYNSGVVSTTQLYVNGVAITGAGATPTWQQVTDAGDTTNHWIQFAGATSTNNIVPNLTNSLTLGTSAYRWANIFSQSGNFSYVSTTHLDASGYIVTYNLTATNANLTNVSSTNIDASGYITANTINSNTANLGNVTTTNLYNSGTVSTTNLYVNGVAVTGVETQNFQDVTNLGVATNHWIQFAGATSTNHFLPGTNNLYNLGSTAYRWANLFAVNGNFTGTVTTTNLFASGYVSTTALYVNGTQITGATPTLQNVTDAGYITNDAIGFAGASSTGHLLPTTNNLYDLGSVTHRWRNLYATNGIFTNVSSTNIDASGYIVTNNLTATNANLTNVSSTNIDASGYITANTINSNTANLGNVTTTNLYNSGTVSTTNLYVNGLAVTGIESQNFQDVTNLGVATNHWIQFAGATSTNHFLPGTNNLYNLGSTAYRWANLFAVNGNFTGTVTTTNLFASGYVSTTQLYVNGVAVTGATPTLQQVTNAGYITSNAIGFAGASSTGHLLPTTNNLYDLGSVTHRWRNLYATNGIFTNVSSTNIDASGYIVTNNLTATNANLTNVSSTNIDASGYITANTLNSNTANLGNVTTTNLYNSGTVSTTNLYVNGVAVTGIESQNFQDVTNLGVATNHWIQFAGATSTNHFLPGTNNLYNLGSTAYRWANLFAVNGNFTGTVTTTNLFASGYVSTTQLYVNGVAVTGATPTLQQVTNAGYITSNAIGFAGASSTGHLLPTTNNLYDLGSVTHRWRNLYVTNGIFTNVSSTNIDALGYVSTTQLYVNGVQITGGGSQDLQDVTDLGYVTTNPIRVAGATSTDQLFVLGSQDAPQFIVQANSTQDMENPLIQFRNSAGTVIGGITTNHESNIFAGFESGAFITSGTYNTALGYRTMYNSWSNITGSYNTALGAEAMWGYSGNNMTGSDNTAVGYRGLASLSSGYGNTAVGYSSLANNTTGYQNNAFGWGALKDNSTGWKNVAIGVEALTANTTGESNTSVGNESMFSNNGDDNVAVGKWAMRLSTTADQAVAIGASALSANNATGTTGVGYHAVYSNISGVNISGVGHLVMESNTTGSDNTAMGASALYYNQTGSGNTSLGSNALHGFTGTSHSNNTGIGYNSLYAVRTGSANTALGGGTLYALTTGASNTAIGYNAGANITTGSNNILIGNDVNALSATGNYHLNIGNSIYGDLSTDNIGIGVPSPYAFKLTIDGHTGPSSTNAYDLGSSALRWRNLYASNGIFANVSSTNIDALGYVSTTNLYVNGSLITGATPTLQQVTDQGYVTTNPIRFAGASSTGHILPVTTLTYDLGSSSNRWKDLWVSSTYIGAATWNLRQSAAGNFTIANVGGSERVTVDTSGNVGIGTASMSERLVVAGNIRLQANGNIDTSAAGSLTIGGTTQNALTVGRSGATTALTGSNFTAGGIAYGASNQLTFTSAGTAGMAVLSGGTGAPTMGTLGLTYGGTNANLSGVATGGILYKDATAIAGTGALTGVLKGNGSSAPSAMTGTANRVSFWSDANTLGTSNLVLSGNNVYPNTAGSLGLSANRFSDAFFSGNVYATGTIQGATMLSYGNLRVDGTTTFNTVTYTWPGASTNGLLRNTGGTISWDTSTYLTSYTETDPTWSGTANTTGAVGRTGDVGIGTVSPGKKLDVDGQLRIRNGGATGYGLLEYGASATAANNWHVGSEGDGTFRFYNGTFGGGTERMRLTSAGNLGVGISPNSIARIHADGGEILTSNNANSLRSVFGNYGLIHRNDGSDYYQLLTDSGDQYGTWNTLRPYKVHLATGNVTVGSTALYVLHGGNVGIGDSTPAALLTVGNGDLFQVNSSGNLIRINNVPYSWPGGNAAGILRSDAGGTLTWDTATYLTSANAFVQNGNSFTADAVLGTNDAYSLFFETNNVSRGVFDTGGTFILSGSANSNRLQIRAHTSQTNNNPLLMLTSSAGFELARFHTDGNTNIFAGYQSGLVNSTGLANSFYGRQTGVSNTTGFGNTALGYQASYSNVGANYNTAVGADALYYNTAGGITGIGGSAAFNNTSGVGNTALGYRASYGNSTGNDNTSVGSEALYFNTASGNTGIGRSAAYSNTSGGGITALGFQSAFRNTTGAANTAIGYHSLYPNQTGNYNTAVGYQAIYASTGAPNSASWNSALGFQVLFNNTTGDNNTAMGMQAMYANSTGSHNVAMGANSLANSTAHYNVGIGSGSAFRNTSGAGNVAIGFQALHPNQTGSNNTAVGYQAIFASTGVANSADYNSAFGFQAMFANTTGQYNTAIGVNTLRANTIGSANVAVGINALTSNTATANVAVGSDAAYRNTSGGGNTAMGYQALYPNQTGTGNTAVGYQAIFATTGAANSASNNSAFGYQAMFANTTGQRNTAMGSLTLTSVTAGSENTAVGSLALASVTTGSNNTSVGYGSLYLSTASNNTALGFQSAYSNTSGAGNIALGYRASYSNAVGSDNTSLGGEALYSNTVSGNTGIGRSAVFRNTSGTGNTGMGYRALYPNQTGTFNTALGYEALYGSGGTNNFHYNTAVGGQTMYFITTGSFNSAFGAFALLGNTTGQFNTGIGFNALLDNQTGSGNTAVGYMALDGGGSGGSHSENTAVGNSALSQIDSGSRNVAMGSLALNSITNGFDNVGIGYFAGAGNTGSGNVSIGSNAFKKFSGSGWNVIIGRNALSDHTGGFGQNVAIGDSALASSTNGLKNVGVGELVFHKLTTGYYNTAIGASAGNNITTQYGNTFIGYLAGANGNYFNSAAIGYGALVNQNRKMRFGDTAILVYEGQVDWTFPSDSRIKTNIVDNPIGLSFINQIRSVKYESIYDLGYTRDGFIAQEVRDTALAMGYAFSGVEDRAFVESGGTEMLTMSYSPFDPIFVNAIQELYASSSPLFTGINIDPNFTALGESFLSIDTDGNLAYKGATIKSQGTASTSTTAFNSHTFSFMGSAWDMSANQEVRPSFNLINNTISASSSEFTLTYSTGTSFNQKLLTITNAGDVKVTGDLHVGRRLYLGSKTSGESSTSTYIFVDDTLSPNSTYISTNADGWQSEDAYDYAERFESSQNLKPGDIVTVDPDGINMVKRATSPSDKLIGIVSTKPGFVTGRHYEGWHPIALAGRVPTRVSTMNGNIRAGDYITATQVPGVGAKAKEGESIIGIALESYNSPQEGLISVFVKNIGTNQVSNTYTTVTYGPEQPAETPGVMEFAMIKAGQKEVNVNFDSLGAFPSVIITPYGSVTGSYYVTNVKDTGFTIVLTEEQTFDLLIYYEVKLPKGNKVILSDGTVTEMDSLTGKVAVAPTPTEPTPEPEPEVTPEPEVAPEPEPEPETPSEP